ncbi:MAG: isoaspartyl peptidase/L-asparaginase [Chromatiales bacterium]|nr:isoaspartyl peptidase/L-asparaginase [Chromatiales bacterium]
MVHGGAGALDNVTNEAEAVRYLEAMRVVLDHGRHILELGGSALEAVEQCAALLEDDPLFNAGAGSVLNEEGRVEMDAAIMCGQTLNAGSVAGVRNIANPIQLARVVLAESEHVMLIGEGAMRFADLHGFERVADHYFLTPDRIAQWEKAHRDHRMGLDHDCEEQMPDLRNDKFGTIGAVAKDSKGNLAAATSTGGIVNKRFGRVGDSPIVGAGVYADNSTCAVSCTGFGEDFLRVALAKTLSDIIEFTGAEGKAAAERGIDYLSTKVNGRGGFIMIDHDGRCCSAFTTKRMIHGWIERGGETVCRF